MTIEYQWHPLKGTTLLVVRRSPRRDIEFLHCQLPDGTVSMVPLWMTDPRACARMSLGAPQVPVVALLELRQLLDDLLASKRGET